MDVERHLLRVGCPALVAEAVDVFAVAAGRERVVFGGNSLSVVLPIASGIFDLYEKKSDQQASSTASAATYPKVDLQIAAAAKLAVTDLEGDRHLIVAVQCLVEAFARVGAELDVVGGGEPDPAQQSD